MIIIKNKLAIDKMRTAGHRLAKILQDIEQFVISGVSTAKLNELIEIKMIESGLKPECKGYHGYCCASCISLNDVVVHGLPSEKVVLKSGDFVKIDVVVSYEGHCADMTRFYFVGEVKPIVRRLAKISQMALDSAIDIARPNLHLSDLSAAVQKVVEDAGFGVVRDFAGHGIGKNMHEDPEIPNFGKCGQGPILKEGMTLAIEPMITQNHWAVEIMRDGWSVKTKDGGLSSHVEDTIVITKNGAEVLTRP